MKELSLDDLQNELKHPTQTSVVIDVRTLDEFNELRLQGTKHIPLHELTDHLDELEPYQTIIVHCAHGFRANKAASYLQNYFGDKEIAYVKGNIEEWEDWGLPIARGE